MFIFDKNVEKNNCFLYSVTTSESTNDLDDIKTHNKNGNDKSYVVGLLSHKMDITKPSITSLQSNNTCTSDLLMNEELKKKETEYINNDYFLINQYKKNSVLF